MPTPSVEAARKRLSSSGCSPAKAPKPGRAGRLDGGAQPLDDRAGGRERDTRGVVAVGLAPQRMEYTTGLRPCAVRPCPRDSPRDLARGLGEALAGQLRAALRAARQEAHDGLADRHRVAARQLEAEDVARALPPCAPGSSALQLQLGQPELSPVGEQLVDPVTRRVHLDAGSRRSSRRTCAGRRAPGRAGSTAPRASSTSWNSSSSSATPRWSTRGIAPVPRLDDDVDRAPLELGQPQLEPVLVELLPARAGLDRDVVVADPAVAGDEVEAELADVARLDVPQLAT